MNKKEIYEYLNYKGKYTKDVEKKLKKLIKKFHPDKNKEDKSTILILYEVKKELENNVVDKKNYKSSKKEESHHEENMFYNLEPFIRRMIEFLKIKRDKKEQEILKVQRQVNYHYKKRINLSDAKNKVLLDIDDISKKYSRYSKSLLISLALIDLGCVIIFIICFNLLTFLILLLSVFVTILYLLARYEFLKTLDKKLEIKNTERDNINEKLRVVDNKIKDLENICVNLKFEKNAISNDIQFYSYELSKILNSSYNLVKEEDKIYKKSI